MLARLFDNHRMYLGQVTVHNTVILSPKFSPQRLFEYVFLQYICRPNDVTLNIQWLPHH